MRRQSTADAGMCVFAIIVFLAILGGVTHRARAQDVHLEGHAEHHDVYQTWCQNGWPKPCIYVNSCCKEKKDGGGDCFPTEATLAPAGAANPDIKGDVWWAKNTQGVWVEVPEGRINHELNPDPTGTRAHLCENQYTGQIFCFVPPTGGS